MKVLIVLTFNLILVNCGLSGNRLLDEALPPKSIEHSSQVKMEFSSRGLESGVIQAFLPNSTIALPLCYPDTFHQQQEAVRLLHVLCKEMGYVTFGNRYNETYPKERTSLSVNSAQCTGLEVGVSQCPWNNIKYKTCRNVLGTKCSSCYSKIVASKGSVHNPGYPHAYLYSLECDWLIEVPDEGIRITFEHFALPHNENKNCESHVDLSYGHQSELHSQRFCSSDLPRILTIPFSNVRIRFLAGTFQQESTKQTHYGFDLAFKAIKMEMPNNSWEVMVTFCVIFICISLMIMMGSCFWYYRCKRGTVNISPRPPEAPGREQINAAFEFHRSAPQRAPEENIQKMDFSIYHSETSSTDSEISRWRSHSSCPVNSALAPLGPGQRMVSIAATPRTVMNCDNRQLTEENKKRIDRVRTKLVARFSSSSYTNNSNISLFFPSTSSNYSKLSCEEDIPAQEEKLRQNSEGKNDLRKIPTITIEFVE